MIFHQAGSYPGIPGLFAGCSVEVDERGNVIETPLAHHPAEAPDSVTAAPIIEETPPAQATIVQEQAAPTSAPQVVGG
jgi:hypothetical protein